MGYLVGETCHPTQLNANDAYFGSIPVGTFPAGSGFFTVRFQTDTVASSGWVMRRQEFNSAAVLLNSNASAAVQPVYPICDIAGRFIDGTVVGWGVASALILAMCIKLLRRAM